MLDKKWDPKFNELEEGNYVEVEMEGCFRGTLGKVGVVVKIIKDANIGIKFDIPIDNIKNHISFFCKEGAPILRKLTEEEIILHKL